MAIIYTYPDGPSPLTGEELIIISDPNNSNSTRNTTAQAIADLNDFEITLDASSTGLSFDDTLKPGFYTVNLSGIVNTSSGGTGLGTIGSANQVLTSNGSSLFYQTGIDGPVLFDAKANEVLAKGDVVYIDGFDVGAGLATVSKADASDANKMPAYGLALQAAPGGNEEIQIVTFGDITGLNTSSFSAGEALYVDTTPGDLTNTPPATEANLIQNIGKVERAAGGTNGIIKVGGAGRTNATPNLNEGSIFIGDTSNRSSILPISATPGDVLTSDGTTASWAAIPTQAAEDLATTLAAGNDTGGTNINVNGTDQIVLNTNTLQLNTLGDANNTLSSNGTDIAFTANRSLVVSTAQGAGTTLTIGSSTPEALLDVRDLTSSNRFRVNPTANEIEFADGGTLGATLAFPTNTVSQTYTLPTDESGIIPVGPAWNTLIANPTAGEDGYVITWDNTAGEYQLLAAGAGLNGIYTGSGSLITDTIVTSANFDLTVNEVSTVRPSIFNVVKGTIPPSKSQDIVAEYLWNGAASGSVDAKVINIANTVSSGASSTTGLNSTVSGLTGPKTAIKAAVVSGGPAPVGADIGLAVNIDNRAINPSEPITYGVYSSVLNNQATTTIAGYFSSLGFGGSTGYAIITNDGQIGFGTSTPDPSALLDVSSTTQAFYPPRMTTAEMNVIAGGSPNEGAILFDITTKQFMGYNGTSWVILG